MGSASSRSSQVHSFQNDTGSSKDVRPVHRAAPTDSKNLQPRKSLQSPVFNDEMERRSEVSSFTTSPTERDALIVQLKKELGESESYNFDLQDRIQLLEEQICNIQTQNDIKEQEENVEGTVQAKDQLIQKVTKEKDQLQQEMNKMKIRYKKRIKVLTSQVNEARQETSIQLFELRDDIYRLTEENKKLNDKLEMVEGNKGSNPEADFLSNSIHGNGQMKIVLELSNQISDQESRISELESLLKDRDELLKLNGISLEQINKKRSSFTENAHIKQEKSAMKKLSSSLFASGNTETVSDEEHNIFSGEDNRGVSGASRDSGIGSADKNGRHNLKSRNKKQLSPLEDSEDSWESDTPLSSRDQSKIRSAPLENQYKRAASRNSSKLQESEEDCMSIDYEMHAAAKSAKLKKKTSFKQRLRRENETSIRTPIPYEAFGGSDNDKSKKGYVKTKKHFFLTQTSSQASTPTNEIDALLMS